RRAARLERGGARPLDEGLAGCRREGHRHLRRLEQRRDRTHHRRAGERTDRLDRRSGRCPARGCPRRDRRQAAAARAAPRWARDAAPRARGAAIGGRAAGSIAVTLALGGIRLADIEPIVDGAPSPEARIETRVLDGRTELTVVLPRGGRLASIGVRLQAHGVRQYLRNGYMSWDGSFFVEPATAREVAKADARLTAGYAMTALLPAEGEGAVVLGFLRHDRFQSRVSFALGEPLGIDLETLIDGVPHEGEVRSETLTIFAGDAVEPALRQWAELVAAASPRRPRLPKRRLTGWCSWYNLYASLSEPVLLEHLAAVQRFRDETQTPFDIFLVDDGFTPEMGDWLETKPQFPNGMRPVLDAARDAGFIPGLWIAPFMVGNRSTLYAEHPDWVVKDRATGAPLAPMKFY